MTDPKETAPDATEPIPTPDASGSAEPVDVADAVASVPSPAPDAEATRAEADAAALAADEVGAEDEPPVVGDEEEIDEDETDLEESDDFEDEVEEETAPVVAAGALADPMIGAAALAGRKARGATPGPAPVAEPAIRINDRASKIFVIATVAVFALIFLNGMLLGTGGTFRPYITPSPAPSESLAPSASPSASGSAAPSGSVGPSAGASGSAVPSASPPPASGSPAPS